MENVMLKKIICFLLFSMVLSIYSQIPSNIQYTRTLDRCVKYEATLLEHNNTLYVDAKGGIEEYQILPDGSLELISYISTYHYTIANAIILGDSLFVATQIDNSYDIYIINISTSPMELVDIINTYSQYGICRMQGNDNYFIFTSSSEIYSNVYDRTTMEFVTQLLTGGFYTVRDNYLYYLVYLNDLSYLFIKDIQDPFNPVEISSLYLSISQQNIGYFFYGDTLFITQNQQVVIINISDVYNPVIISIINDIPNVPSVNFFTSLIIYEDQVMFGNTDTIFWIYEISTLSNPQFILMNTQFVNGSSYKNSLLLHEDKIYYTRTDRNISLLDADELPDLNIIDEYGNLGQFQFFDFAYPYILYSDPFQLKQFCLNINNPNPEPICLAESPNGWVSPVCYNDSLVCFLTAEIGTDNLVICQYSDENIYVANTIPLGTSNFNYVFFRGEHLILSGYSPGEISINILNSDYTLNEVGNFIVGQRSYLIDQTDHCNNDFLFIRSQYNGEYLIEVFENQVPFNQITSFELSCNNHQFDTFYFLENDRALLCSYNYPEGLYYLCDYTFPDTFELLDSYSSSTAFFTLNDNYLFWREDLSGPAKFYLWQNDEIELVQSYDFEVETYNAFLVQEQSRFYAGGRYNVQEYSCDFVSVNDNQIPILDANLSNHPNPFNPLTKITYTLFELGKITLDIYNAKGQKVKSLIDCEQPSGTYEVYWNGGDQYNKPVASGVYFCTLKTQTKNVSRKMILLK